MKYKISFSVFMLLLFIFIGCSNKRKEHDELVRNDLRSAQTENTIISYENFISKHPDSKWADYAHKKIEFLKFEKIRKEIEKEINEKEEKKKLEAQTYEESEAANTIFSFQNYLDKYPEGVFAEKAKTKIKEIIDGRHDAYKNVKTALLYVNESSPNVKNYDLGFKNDGVKSLYIAGVKTIFDGKSSEYDAILNINVEYKALSAHYGLFGDPYHPKRRYSGAQIVGTISFVVPGIHSVKKSFKGIIACPKSISGKYETPEQAPLLSAKSKLGSFRSTFIKMMVDIFGGNYLIAILNDIQNEYGWGQNLAPDEMKYVRSLGAPCMEELIDALNIRDGKKRRSVIWILGEIGDPRAVEPLLYAKKIKKWRKDEIDKALARLGKPAIKPLIEQLKNENRQVQLYAEKVLNEITGKEFGGDYDKWNMWWEQNK
jgi:hypothetical protein